MRLFDNIDLSRVVNNYVQRTTPDGLPFIRKVVTQFILSIFGSDDIHDKGTQLSNITDITSDDMFLLKEYDSKVNLYFDPLLQSILSYSLIRKDINLYKLIGEKVFGGAVELTYGISFNQAQSIATTDLPIDCYTDIPGTCTDSFEEGKIFILYTFPYSFLGDYPTWEESEYLINKYASFFSIIKSARHNVIFITEPHLVWDYNNHIGIIQTQTPFSDDFSVQFLSQLSINEISEHLTPSIDSSDYSYTREVNTEDRSITFRFISKQTFDNINFDFDFVPEQSYFNSDQDEDETSDISIITDDIPSAELVPFRGALDPSKIKVVQYQGYVPVVIKLCF